MSRRCSPRGQGSAVIATIDRFRFRPLFIVMATAMAGASMLTGCEPSVPQYAAVGDSFTAGPAIGDRVGEPEECWRSSDNYPHRVHQLTDWGEALVPDLLDASCGGATVADMYEPQAVLDGPNVPQAAIANSRTRVVTIGIGANDIGYAPFMFDCIEAPSPGGCRAGYVDDDGNDVLRDRIATLRPKIPELVEYLHDRAPDAAVYIVGYPTIVPPDGHCPLLDVPEEDFRYLSGVFDDLNAALADGAAASEATFVDTATSSVGHDLCAGDAAWVNPPANPLGDPGDGLPYHPNAAGTDHTAQLVTTAVEAGLNR